MANTFGILAALVLAFATFVAFKNKDELKQTIDTVGKESAKLKRNEKTYKEIVEDVEILDNETNEFEAEARAKNADIEKQEAMNSDIETQIAEKEAAAKEAEAKADEADATFKELGDTRTLIVELKQLRQDIADLNDEIAVNETKVSQLENEKSETTTLSKDLSGQLSKRNTGKSYFVSARVRSIYRNWGFVTIGAGDNAGVVAKSKLKVMRGDKEIAQLLVTAVEENTAAANIIPSSVDPEEDISVGDVVIPADEDEQPES